MHNTMIVYLLSGVLGVIGLLAGVGAGNVVEKATKPPAPISMHLKDLRFENGEFAQSFRIMGADAIGADWTAKITRGERILCSGGGRSAYSNNTEGEFARMSPSDWTNAKCPKSKPGDVGLATWTYRTTEGYFVTISGEVTVTEEGLKVIG